MAVSSPALRDALGDIAGREHVLADGAAVAAAAIDGVVPRWVVRPGGADEVTRVLGLASSEGLAVAPKGSGSSLGLGNPPRRLDMVLDLSRMAGVTEYVPADLVATVQAGTTLGALGARLSRERQRLPLDPPRGSSRTIGGVLATHASGPIRFRYGTGRDLLLGAKFVQADGTLTWGGSKVVKSVTGYDVPKLLVGSLGTLGVIVEATLRLHPVPLATGSWRCAFPSPAATEGFLADLLASSLEPERLALVNENARRICGWNGSGLAILVSVGSVDEAVAAQGSALAALAGHHGGDATPVAAAEWQGLEAALDAPVVLKLSALIRNTVAWLARAEDLATRAGLQMAVVGQAGNGVLHLALRGSRSGPELGEKMLTPLREELHPEGGSLVIERAPAELKAGQDAWGPLAPGTVEIMSRLKREFDPLGVLNPGRFVGGL